MPRVRPFPQTVLMAVDAVPASAATAVAGFAVPPGAAISPKTAYPSYVIPHAGRLPVFARWLFMGLFIAVCCLVTGCGSSTDTMQRKLDKIANEDLQDIVKEIPEKARSVALAKPYFKVDEYKEFHGDTAIVYQAMATLVFFYLDPSLDLCQVRQYRYKTSSGIWDRYDVKLMHFPKKYSGIGPQ